jgi:hypothetical protein
MLIVMVGAVLLAAIPMFSPGISSLHAFPDRWTAVTAAVFLISVGAAVFAAIVLHEAGHALAGIGLGFKVKSMRIGMLNLEFPFRFSLHRRQGMAAGGWVELYPRSHDHLVARSIAMLFAGAAMNVLSAAAVLAAPVPKGTFAVFFIGISFAAGLVNVIPFRAEAVYSDGARIFMLVFRRAHGERWLALLGLFGELREGIPPESLSPALLANAVAVRDASSDTVGAYALARLVASARGDEIEAARALETCLESAGFATPAMRDALVTDAAMCEARRGHVETAAEWLADIPAKTEHPWLRAHAESAILAATGDAAGAMTKLEEVERLIRAHPNWMLKDLALLLVHREMTELSQNVMR